MSGRGTGGRFRANVGNPFGDAGFASTKKIVAGLAKCKEGRHYVLMMQRGQSKNSHREGDQSMTSETTRFSFTTDFRTLLETCRQVLDLDATEFLVWGMNGMTEAQILDEIAEIAWANRNSEPEKHRAVAEAMDAYYQSKRVDEEFRASKPEPKPARQTPAQKRNAEIAAKVAEACKAGVELSRSLDDGGTCNLDSPVLAVERYSKGLDEALRAAGVSASWWPRWGFMLSPGLSGQGNARSAGAEEVTRRLKAADLPATTYYQMD